MRHASRAGFLVYLDQASDNRTPLMGQEVTAYMGLKRRVGAYEIELGEGTLRKRSVASLR